ncbi:MAG TPA: CpsD/CapB family tyrosine-protein kinase [Steroidobacteraceae bacterium]|nr:CpsD/CapB family tyrosine-protein kinase [Steroidobacteraceae bacterium]
MSPESAEGLARPIDAELSDALIAHCNLSGQDIDRITEAMRERRQSFYESALQLNLATREDIDDVLHRMRERSRAYQPSVIEAAIRSAKGATTALTVRQGMARLSSALIHARDADSTRSEKIRALRTDLMLLNDSAQRGNVFALVSPGRGEGRSQLCAELAIAFAELGRRTLLVDADLRHPRQHVLFTAENQWGLAQSLALEEAPYLHSVQGLPELAVLTSGPIPPNPLELVSSRRFERLITALRRQHDFIVIDTPAVSQYADALQVATLAQRVLVLSRSEATSLQSLKDMLRRLTVTESRILGAVINRF